MNDIVRSNLCVHDPRSDMYSTFNVSDDVVPPRNGCCCDRCFYGRDALALEIERLQETVAEAERLLKTAWVALGVTQCWCAVNETCARCETLTNIDAFLAMDIQKLSAREGLRNLQAESEELGLYGLPTDSGD